LNAVITVGNLILAARTDATLREVLVHQPARVTARRHLQPQVAETAGIVLKESPRAMHGIWY
jgi:hypothetical protein